MGSEAEKDRSTRLKWPATRRSAEINRRQASCDRESKSSAFLCSPESQDGKTRQSDWRRGGAQGCWLGDNTTPAAAWKIGRSSEIPCPTAKVPKKSWSRSFRSKCASNVPSFFVLTIDDVGFGQAAWLAAVVPVSRGGWHAGNCGPDDWLAVHGASMSVAAGRTGTAAEPEDSFTDDPKREMRSWGGASERRGSQEKKRLQPRRDFEGENREMGQKRRQSRVGVCFACSGGRAKTRSQRPTTRIMVVLPGALERGKGAGRWTPTGRMGPQRCWVYIPHGAAQNARERFSLLSQKLCTV
jgi:hypothetical protein